MIAQPIDPPMPPALAVQTIGDDVAAFMRSRGIAVRDVPVRIQPGPGVASYDFEDDAISVDPAEVRDYLPGFEDEVDAELVQDFAHEYGHQAQGFLGSDYDCTTLWHATVDAVGIDVSVAWQKARWGYVASFTPSACQPLVTVVRRMSTAACRAALGASRGDRRCGWPGMWATRWRQLALTNTAMLEAA